ncbi:MAG: glutaredoxin [Chloroflexi bacterium]|nr:glutaredoxin [Chloroflexota bacterium]
MPLLSDKDRQFLENHFKKNLQSPVTLTFFTQTIACQFCRETEQILQEVAALSDKITLEVFNFITDKEVAEQYWIDKIPATVIRGEKDYGIRFYGIPSGYEFTSLIEDIVDVSRGKAELSDQTLEALKGLKEPVHIQVFVTPTCPYCPAAVRMGHSLAIASDKIRADMVESTEFPHLANKYQVYGVPRTVINESVHVEGAAPEPLFVAKVLQAAGLFSQEEVDKVQADYNAQVEKMQAAQEGKQQ